MDIFSKRKRSEVMSKIRSHSTRPELLLKEALKGIYLRYQPKGILGSPDLASKKHKVAVFVDGDFWHGYNWERKGKTPPKGFWQDKIQRNMRRDRRYTKKLRAEGWIVMRFWEHQVLSNPLGCAAKVFNRLGKAGHPARKL